ncbi:unnamed protein product [Lymnaea stagnalis]|uniref:Uncharacterized protein n=1 Tax=Lymnaea stagnalis TaxID=6523 RepID=A0AAV2I739_LYMST
MVKCLQHILTHSKMLPSRGPLMFILLVLSGTCVPSTALLGRNVDDLLQFWSDAQTKATSSGLEILFKNNATSKTSLLAGWLAHGKVTTDMVACELPGELKDQGQCLEWTNGWRVESFWKNLGRLNTVTGLQCSTVHWRPPQDGAGQETPEDCYNMTGFYWFGGFESSSQVWPINTFQANSSAFITGDTYQSFMYGGVLEGMFLSSSGVGIYVDETTPLYLSVNQAGSHMLCLKGKVGANTPFFNVPQAFLKYDICKAANLLELWRGVSEVYLPKPAVVPSSDVLRHPVWTTWASYKENINDSTVLEFAEDVLKNNFSISQLEIDDRWTPHYGDFVFDNQTFSGAANLIKNLTQKGIVTTVWMHPFLNTDSNAFRELSAKGYLIQELNSSRPHVVTWWRGSAGVIDVTNPDAVKWYLEKVKALRDAYNVTSFKFDAGEISWIGGPYKLSNQLAHPNYLTRTYIEMTFLADTDQRRQEVRVGYRSQASTLMVRMLDRQSDWSNTLGLKTLIPCALVFGFMGYPYVLPDMIGGNAYGPNPDSELFVRWLQATVFMPVLQFSITPWSYNATVLELTGKYIRLHEQYADKIVDLADHAQKTGEPINRPLWWLDPEDTTALQLDSEFLLGDDLLVAPVLEQGARSRDIYLPKGQWRDELRGRVVQGGAWIRNYPASLEELPYFTKIG